jgi:hypothetical protein
MKTIKNLRVNFLRVYPEVREVESSVTKTKGKRAGALVLMDMLPHSDDQAEANAIELSPKQLDNLASMHGIRSTGREAWNDLAVYIGVGKSVAVVSAEEHKKGDTYIDADSNEQKYTKTSTNCGVDSIILPDKVTNTLVEKTIEKNINWKDQDDLIARLTGDVDKTEINGVK